MSHPAERRLTPEEYLELERASEERREYFAGETFLLAGASRAHNRIVTNLVSSLDRKLRTRECDVYGSDFRVLVESTGLYAYPDVVVTCGEERYADDHRDVLLNPRVIFEVLSPSTEAYDRGRKFEQYQQVESLAEYLLVAQDARRIEQFVRQGASWIYTDHRFEGSVALPSLGCSLDLDDVFRRVPLGPNRLR